MNPRAATGWIRLLWKCVSVTGPDALSFLQSVLTQEVGAEGVPTLLLEPKGRLEYGMWAFPIEDGLVLAVEPGEEDGLVAALTRWRIRVKADIQRAGGWDVVEVRGIDAAASGGAPWEWPGLPGRLHLVPAGSLPGVADAGSEIDPATREIARIEAGVPRVGRGLDAPPGIIPQEAGLEKTAVSFTKGCFVGQELVCRIDSRGGNVPRRLRGVIVAGAGAPPPGASVVGSSGDAVGTLSSSAWSERLGAAIGLAIVGRAVEPGASVRVQWDSGGAEGEVRELPLVS